MRITRFLRIVFVLLGLAAADAGADFPGTADRLRETIARLQLSEGRSNQSEPLLRFYTRRAFQPAWQDPVHARSMIAAIRAAETHGLEPNHYHMETLQRLVRRTAPAGSVANRYDARLDILLTDSFFRLAHAYAYGWVDPVRFNPDWNFAPAAAGEDMVPLLTAALTDGRIEERLEGRAPSHPLYRRLRNALARYRQIAAAGGWGPIPEGPPLEIGVRDVRVPLLRERLTLTGDLSIDTDGDPLVFERPLARAVLRFQERNRVDRESSQVNDDDGAVGEATRAALNVPVEARIRQLRVNLERCRWIFHDQPASFIMVDMAGYRGYLFKDDEVVWRARIQVGDPYRETPSFRSAITRVEFNPTWTVPQGILKKSVLPKIRKDRTYLEKNHMQVYDRDRRPVDPATVDWSHYTAANLPFRIVQSPGPRNAVGRVKFIMPNQHFIYLHDTPYKSKFGPTDRAFSAGCIRVDKPYKLAKRLLDSASDAWTIGRIREILATNQTRNVSLADPLPVLLIYLTAMVDDQGQVHFREDVYKRDAPVADALDPPVAPVDTEAPQSAG